MAKLPGVSSLKDLPSIRQLRAFVAVYQSGNLSAAAEMLSITQPAVTVLIRELEEKLGIRLFDRTTRRLNRTEAAEEAIVHAERVLRELEEMGRSMSDFAGSRQGRLRIAATATMAQTVLPSALGRFRELHPEIKVLIDDCSPREFVERIAGDHVDLGIGTLESRIPGLEEIAFFHDALVAAAPPDDNFIAGEPMSWEELANQTVIAVKPGYGVRRQIDRAALEAGVSLRIGHEVSLLTTALALATGGLGVAIVPSMVLQRSPYPTLVSRPLVGPQVTRRTAAIYKEDRTLSPAATSFINTVLALFAPA